MNDVAAMTQVPKGGTQILRSDKRFDDVLFGKRRVPQVSPAHELIAC